MGGWGILEKTRPVPRFFVKDCSSTEYELDLPAGRSCEAEAEGSDELFELEAERSTRCSDLNPFSKQ